MDDISVDFSGEELVVLCRLARVETLPGVETVTERADAPTARAVLGAVERGLVARRVASPGSAGSLAPPGSAGEQGPELLPVARQLIITLARPAIRARARWSQNGSSTELQYAAIGPVAVELRSVQDGIYRLTPFPPEDLLDRMMARLPLAERPAPPTGQGFRLPGGDLQQALRLGRNGDIATARYVLTDAASPAVAARAFAGALGPEQVTVAVEVTYLAGGGKVRGGEVSWVDGGDAGLWTVPPGFGYAGPAARDAAEVAPTSSVSLRREILSYFPTALSAPSSASSPEAAAASAEAAAASGSGPSAGRDEGEEPSRRRGSRVEP